MWAEVLKPQPETTHDSSDESCWMTPHDAIISIQNQCDKFHGEEKTDAEALKRKQTGTYIKLTNERGEIEKVYTQKNRASLHECSIDIEEECLSWMISEKFLNITSVSELRKAWKKMSNKTREGIQKLFEHELIEIFDQELLENLLSIEWFQE